jgi:hypothetical protein
MIVFGIKHQSPTINRHNAEHVGIFHFPGASPSALGERTSNDGNNQRKTK